MDKEEILEKIADWDVHSMPMHILQPTLQRLSRCGVKVEHFNQLRENSDQLKRVTRAIRSGGWRMTSQEEEVFDILGENAFISAHESSPSLHPYIGSVDSIKDEEKDIPYSMYILKECAHENKQGRADWKLVYLYNLTPHTIRLILGGEGKCDFQSTYDVDPIDSLHKWNEDYHKSLADHSFADQKVGYRLINFKAIEERDAIEGLRAKEQDELVNKLHPSCRVVPANWLIEAIYYLSWKFNYRFDNELRISQSGNHHCILPYRRDTKACKLQIKLLYISGDEPLRGDLLITKECI
jgi:hypothetical protein